VQTLGITESEALELVEDRQFSDNGRRLLLIAEHYTLHLLLNWCDSAGDGLAVKLLALARNSDRTV